jgi:hypothetical protein
MDFTETILQLNHFKSFVSAAAPHWIAVIFILTGFAVLLFRRNSNAAYRLLSIYALIIFLLMAYNYARQAIEFMYLPLIVPSLHYVVYLTILEAFLFGLGAAFIAGKLSILIIRFFKNIGPESAIREHAAQAAAGIIIAVGLLPAFLFIRPGYEMRGDYGQLKLPAVVRSKNMAYDQLYRWMLANTAPDDVFLNDRDTPDYVLMTGRKFVVNPGRAQFSNPYVDYGKRLKDRNLMTQALEYKRYDALYSKAVEYKTGWVIANAKTCADYWGSPGFLKQAFASRWTAVYKIDPNGLRKAAEEKVLREEPYSALADTNSFADVTVFRIQPRNFNAFERERLADSMRGWRWIQGLDGPDGAIELRKLLVRLSGDRIIITSRKALMEFIASAETARFEGSGLIFCGFTHRRDVLKLQTVFPEKVIIASEKSGIWKTMKSCRPEIFPLSTAKASIRSFRQDDISFLRSAYAYVFNSGWKGKYLDYWLEKLKAGKAGREDILDSLLKQASEINY